MELAYLSFSDTGYELAQRLSKEFGGEAGRSGQPDKDGKLFQKHEKSRLTSAKRPLMIV